MRKHTQTDGEKIKSKCLSGKHNSRRHTHTQAHFVCSAEHVSCWLIAVFSVDMLLAL